MALNWTGAVTQVVFVGCLACCCPGMFNAMQGLGNAGSASSDAASAANATLYGTFAVIGYFGGFFFNMLGNRILMLVGGASYCFYSVAMYLAGQNAGLGWLTIVAGAALGFGASWFWTAQGAMMMAYSSPDTRGRNISIFWIIFNLGGMLGGLLMFGINFKSESETISAASYFVFVGIMACGAAGALMLAPPSSVTREDGEPVVFERARSVGEEICGAISVITDPHMLRLTVLFVSSNWFYTYQFGAANGAMFNMRSRGFNSALYWGSQMFGSWVLGKVLDKKTWTNRRRGLVSFCATVVLFSVAYIMGGCINYLYLGGFDKVSGSVKAVWKLLPRYQGVADDKLPTIMNLDSSMPWEPLDLGDASNATFPIIVYLLYGMADAMLQTFAYWMMGAIAADDASLCPRYAGFYKGVQSAGAAVSWALDTKIQYIPQFWVCVALFLASIPFTMVEIFELDDTLPSHKLHPREMVSDVSAREEEKSRKA